MSAILVIDDDEIFLAVVSKLLRLAGYDVQATADGPRAIAMFQARRQEVVLLDVGLPSMNGIEVLRTLRSIEPRAKVIVVTGYASPAVRDAALREGAIDVLSKPVKSEVLLDRIRTAISVAAIS